MEPQIQDDGIKRERCTWNCCYFKVYNENQAAKLLIEELKIPITEDQYLAERNAGHVRMYLEVLNVHSCFSQEKKFPFCRPLPGVMRLIKHLKDHNIPIAVISEFLFLASLITLGCHFIPSKSLRVEVFAKWRVVFFV
jgi:hypothetical protein